MSDNLTVLITGVAGYWGARLAQRLAKEPDLRVLGLDVKPPPDEIAGLDFVPADSRNPLLAELLQLEQVDAVCHLDFHETLERSERAFDLNVMGTMKLFGACAEAGVSKIVLKSSTKVYGAHPDNSAFLPEDAALRGDRNYGYLRDRLEIEAFCSGFRGQSPETSLTVLRFANILGLTADTPMIRFLNRQTTPMLLGFDPLLQFIHEDDVVEALAFSVLNDVPGVFNVAADGPMPLTRVLSLVRKAPLPILHPLADWGLELLQGTRLSPMRFLPLPPDYLRYSCIADLARMHEQLGYSPEYSAEEALREFAGPRRLERDGHDLAYDEERLRNIIERRRRAQEHRPVVDDEA